jgi:hypothetical protein
MATIRGASSQEKTRQQYKFKGFDPKAKMIAPLGKGPQTDMGTKL